MKASSPARPPRGPSYGWSIRRPKVASSAARKGVDVGDKIQLRLVATEPTKGFIDFVRI